MNKLNGIARARLTISRQFFFFFCSKKAEFDDNLLQRFATDKKKTRNLLPRCDKHSKILRKGHLHIQPLCQFGPIFFYC